MPAGGYDHDKYRRQVRAKGITPVIARRGTEHGSGLGVHRWVARAAGRAAALVSGGCASAGRSATTSTRAFLSLACAIICWRRLTNLSLC